MSIEYEELSTYFYLKTLLLFESRQSIILRISHNVAERETEYFLKVRFLIINLSF